MNNHHHACGPATAQNQVEMIHQLKQIDGTLQSFGATQSESVLKAKLEFAFSDVHERQIYPARLGQLITRVVLIVTAAFDDLDARVSVGDEGDRHRLLPAGSTDLTEPCTFSAHPNYAYSADTSISLFISPANSTQGRGIIYLYCD